MENVTDTVARTLSESIVLGLVLTIGLLLIVACCYIMVRYFFLGTEQRIVYIVYNEEDGQSDDGDDGDNNDGLDN